MNFKNINRVFLYFMLFNVCCVSGRMLYTQTLAYSFLIWNLFLAYIPYIISYTVYMQRVRKGIKQAVVLGAWVLFLPNAPYIITDFIHLGESSTVPKWLDILVLFTNALCGLFLGVVSIIIMQQYLKRFYTKQAVNYFIGIVIILCGYGIFMGRYLRWNSWDIVMHPIALLQESVHYITRPLQYPKMCAIICFFSVLQYILIELISRCITSKESLSDSNQDGISNKIMHKIL